MADRWDGRTWRTSWNGIWNASWWTQLDSVTVTISGCWLWVFCLRQDAIRSLRNNVRVLPGTVMLLFSECIFYNRVSWVFTSHHSFFALVLFCDFLFLFFFSCFLQSDSNASYLRAARAGNLEKVLDYLKSGVEINICNQVCFTKMPAFVQMSDFFCKEKIKQTLQL